MFNIAKDEMEKIKTDDVALMELGIKWLRFAFWKEPTMPIDQEVLAAKQAQLGIKE